MARNYAALLHDYLEEMEDLSDAEFGRLCRSLLEYSMTGTFPALSGNERHHVKRVRMQEDRYQASYEESTGKRREAGRKGAAVRRDKAEQSQALPSDAKQSQAVLSDAERSQDRASKTSNNKKEKENKNNTMLSNDSNSDSARTVVAVGSAGDDIANPDLRSVMDYYLDKINAAPSPSSTQEIIGYTAMFGRDVMIHAFDAAIDSGVRNWVYIRGILQRYARDGVKSMQDVQRLEDDFRARTDKRTSRKEDAQAAGPGNARERDIEMLKQLFAEEDAND